MKNTDLFLLKQVIAKIKDKGSNKFKLQLILNEGKIDERIKALEELKKPSEDEKALFEKRDKIVLEHAEISENGNVVLYNAPNGGGGLSKGDRGYPNIVKDFDEYSDKIKALETEFEDTLKEMGQRDKEFSETLQEKTDIELRIINFEDVPEIEYDFLKVLIDTGLVIE